MNVCIARTAVPTAVRQSAAKSALLRLHEAGVCQRALRKDRRNKEFHLGIDGWRPGKVLVIHCGFLQRGLDDLMDGVREMRCEKQ